MITNKKPPFIGASCAIVTPFRSDGGIDLDAFERLIERQIEGGIASITVAGTTGESATLSDREHHKLIEFAVKKVKGRVPVIAGAGSNDTHHAVYLTESACDAGCDGILSVTPYYNKASEKGLVRHFSEIANASSVPVILYNVPSRTGLNIPLPVYRKLAEHERIVGVKEAGTDMGTTVKLCSEFSSDSNAKLYIYSGNDELTLPLLSLGAVGTISVAANIFPRRIAKICNLFLEGNTDAARNIHLSLVKLYSILFCEPNPIPVKAALSMMGLCSDRMRLPLCEAGEDSIAAIDSVLRELKVLIP